MESRLSTVAIVSIRTVLDPVVSKAIRRTTFETDLRHAVHSTIVDI